MLDLGNYTPTNYNKLSITLTAQITLITTQISLKTSTSLLENNKLQYYEDNFT